MNAQKKQLAKEIFEESRNFTMALQILVADVKYAEDQRAKDKSYDQFWRRTIIRAVCALGEGTLNSLKGMMPKSAAFFETALTDTEIAILTEAKKTSDGKSRPYFLPIQQNIKETFKLFTKIHGVQMDIKYDQGYEKFCGTFNLRNRLMHPRKHFDLEIKDDDYQASIKGWNWFNFTLNNILAECKIKLPFRDS